MESLESLPMDYAGGRYNDVVSLRHPGLLFVDLRASPSLVPLNHGGAEDKHICGGRFESRDT